MRKKKFIILFIITFFLLIFIIGNIKTTRLIGINYIVTEYEIPIYLKILDFYNRHYNYKHIVKNITKNTNNEKDIVLNTAKWVKKNIKIIPKGVDIIDHHPLTIVERRLGTSDQFSDLLSVLLVYSNIDSFFISKSEKDYHSLTFFNIYEYWSIIDPYYGIFFTNNERLFASIEDLKNGKWQISNLEFEKINSLNFKNTFGNKFNTYEEVIYHYNEFFNYLLSNNQIENTNIFNRGGRSYTQSPFGRIKYTIYNLIKMLGF